MTIGVAIIGYGYWGPNLLRVFSGHQAFRVVAVADLSGKRRSAAKQAAPHTEVMDDPDAAIRHTDVGLVAIATPVATHYDLARRAFDSRRHVLVEKPLTGTAEEATDLLARAKAAGRELLVDHTFLFTDAVRKIIDLARDNTLGSICYYDSIRVNLGLFQPDVNVLWDLAPHDLSIIDQIFQTEPIHISAQGYSHLNKGIPDLCYVTLRYPSNQVAHLNLSWMSPVKVRRVAIGGTRRMLIWNDLDQDEKIKIYDAGLEYHTADERPVIVPDYRIGDVLSPRISRTEALVNVADHVASIIEGRCENDIISGARGVRIVQILERAQRELEQAAPAPSNRC